MFHYFDDFVHTLDFFSNGEETVVLDLSMSIGPLHISQAFMF
jgi:hypothetical protein